MDNVYVLEIPDLQQVLNQEDIAVWELFLLTAEKRYEKIRFQVSSDGGCYTFRNVEACNGLLATVQIDFDLKKIIFVQGVSNDKEFESFLFDALSQLFVRVKKDRIQFLATSGKSKIKGFSTRR
ncbi:hypothetical protein [Planomicrobium okeanokoites]|uniref:DUF1828 domain-containing protein n=1 Tax=Planomicrobium okeanokoites TaxID=244 RepID=A0ABV7KM37_PLAOK|nr:hypothetical protein [Planomicrobium okeanokoites]TAA68189.1 hypothetical protein D2910_11895 [Planomicrobium okeanokoites]